jgi:hypothetical protein
MKNAIATYDCQSYLVDKRVKNVLLFSQANRIFNVFSLHSLIVSMNVMRLEKFSKSKCILTFKVICEGDCRRYLSSIRFYVKYDKPITHLDDSILNILGVACLSNLAWATDSILLVDELDYEFLNSLNRFKDVLNDFYPDLDLRGEIIVENQVKNRFSNSGTGLLFNGGLNSTCSYITEKENQPVLYSIIGR